MEDKIEIISEFTELSIKCLMSGYSKETLINIINSISIQEIVNDRTGLIVNVDELGKKKSTKKRF